jgi:hypothetical protein
MNRSIWRLLARVYQWVYNIRIGRYYLGLWIEKIYNYVESNAVIFFCRNLLSHRGDEVHLEEIDRNSDTLFVMVSGYSVNDISEAEWEALQEQGDVFSFNYFFRGEFVPVDYHLVRETESNGTSAIQCFEDIRDYVAGIDSNPCYDNTTYFVLNQYIGWFDRAGVSAALATFCLRGFSGQNICFFQNDRSDSTLPGEAIDEINHHVGTLFDVINIGYLLGYSNIVLVGVDLYDRQYFWLKEGETRKTDEQRDVSADDEHNTAGGVLDQMPEWGEYLSDHGVSLYVENERSLLHTESILPTYDISDLPRTDADTAIDSTSE